MKLRLFSLIAAVSASILLSPAGAAQELPYQIFERYLEPLAQQLGLPGLSAVIVRNNVPEWQKGYGFSDVESQTLATPDTLYPIGGVTQAMTAVLVGVCSDRFALDVDQPIRNWVPTFPETASLMDGRDEVGVTVRHILAHVSENRFNYDPARYTALTPVVEECTKQPFRLAVAEEILNKLAMRSSVPGLDLGLPEGQAARQLFSASEVARYQALLRTRLATPYRVERSGNSIRSVRSEYPSYGLDAASGMVASARDLADFERELDDTRNNVPIGLSTFQKMWVPFVLESGAIAPTGQGWFVQTVSGVTLVWTFGHLPDASSALIVKMPKKFLTLVLLSNSGGLAYELEKGDISNSPFVKVFLRLFI